MIAAELKLKPGERVDFVLRRTRTTRISRSPRHSPRPGFNVMCDKPLTFDLAQAEELAKVVQKTGVVFGVTHNYTAIRVRQAREMIQSGELGEINAIRRLLHPGLAAHAPRNGGPEAGSWRTDPKPLRRAAVSATSARTPTT